MWPGVPDQTKMTFKNTDISALMSWMFVAWSQLWSECKNEVMSCIWGEKFSKGAERMTSTPIDSKLSVKMAAYQGCETQINFSKC